MLILFQFIQKMDNYDRPWMPESLKNPKPKSRKGQSVAVPIQGEILRPFVKVGRFLKFEFFPQETGLCHVLNVSKCINVSWKIVHFKKGFSWYWKNRCGSNAI